VSLPLCATRQRIGAGFALTLLVFFAACVEQRSSALIRHTLQQLQTASIVRETRLPNIRGCLRVTSLPISTLVMIKPRIPLFSLLSIMCASAALALAAPASPAITSKPFGELAHGAKTTLYTLQNANGFRVDITDFGAIVVSIYAPDKSGKLADVALGLKNAQEYYDHTAHFGGIVGRYGNRIAKGQFTVDGRTYSLAINNTPGHLPCTLHGGLVGFDKYIWDAEPKVVDGNPTLVLSRLSHDGEEGFPGNLTVHVTYTVTADNALRIDYQLTTDKATPVNLTNHSYFNLHGEGNGTILDHVVTINATHMTPVNAGMIPTGEIAPVAGTPMDFTAPHAVGERIDSNYEQLKLGIGYDHNWVLDHKPGELAPAATAYDPTTGRVMEVFTTEPGVQFYTGNFLDGTLTGKSGKAYVHRGGLCFESQHFPDSPNHPSFPTTILEPGKTFHSTTVYRFGVK
jgi:aldose 1-epimerase